ncbi:MAG: sigma-70 family RNA polymerase sigma factor [Planctomycetota bacterium]
MASPQDAIPPAEDPTAAHIRGARAGSVDSQLWLVNRFTPALLASAGRRHAAHLAPLADPADVLQDVWSNVFRRLDTLEFGSSTATAAFLAYLNRALNNCYNDLARRARREERAPGSSAASGVSLGAQPHPSSGVVTKANRRDAGDRLLKALAELPETDREVLILRGIEQRSLGEIEELLGVPSATISKRFQRALVKIRKILPQSFFADLDGA